MKADKILLVPHQNPDGDALGAVSAFAYFLQKINKPHATFCLTETPAKYDSLAHLITLENNADVWQDESFDRIVVLDSSDLRYAGIAEHLSQISYQPIIINIDHHATNEFFGQHNLVVSAASSTSEVLYHFFKHNEIEIDKKIANNLLTGILSDTDNFTNPGTTVASLSIAGNLINRGANFNLLRELLFKDKTINSLKLWGLALSRLDKRDELDIIYTYLTKDDLGKYGAGESETEGISNFFNNLNEGKASLFLKELPDGNIKGSLRTSREDFDVSELAQKFGGGGHKKAAGFTIAGNVDEVLNKVWETLQSAGK